MLPDSFRASLALPLTDEELCVNALLPLARLSDAQRQRLEATAQLWLPNIRAELKKADPIERLIHRIRLDEP
ncbi:MAG TPA: hypothetical protein VHB73_01450, partial [Alphaproteobacteria bacterium]|nr:hypothetical protein [Alphaproteobacteria bacterium]